MPFLSQKGDSGYPRLFRATGGSYLNAETPPSSAPTGKPPARAFAYQAARASWLGPILIFILFTAGHQIVAQVVLELIALVLIVAGICLGVAALFGIRNHGKKGILTPALVGLILNGLLLFIFITNFLAARAKHNG